MTAKFVAKGKSLAWTGTGGPTSPCTKLQKVSLPAAEVYELAEFLDGDRNIDAYYRGKQTAEVTVEVADMAVYTAFKTGQVFTNLVVVASPAKTSAGSSVGTDLTYTMSCAVVKEIGGLELTNDNAAPVVGSITFALHYPHDAVSAPTAGYSG